MSVNSNYFNADLTHTLVKPVLAAGIVFAYTHFTDKSYNASMKNHLISGAIAGGATLVSRYGISMIPSPSSEGLRSIEHMALGPVLTGGAYALGRKMLQGSNDLMMDGIVGGATCVASGYLESPIDRFFLK
jgi:hypothetical protein